MTYYTTKCADGDATADGSCPVSSGPSMDEETVIGVEIFTVGPDGVQLRSQELNEDVLTVIEEGGEVEMEEVKKYRQRWAYDDGEWWKKDGAGVE